MHTSRGFSFLAVAILASSPAAYARHGDAKNTSRAISGVTSQFALLNTVIRSGEPIKIRVTLHNESTSPVEFRYVIGSFIEHVRIYDSRDRQVPVRLNAPFLESGADKVNLRPGEQFVSVVTADLWQIYDLEPGTYELRFYYDLRLIADETLAAKSMKRYHSKDWVLWDTKKYPLTVVDQEISGAIRNSPDGAIASQRDSIGVLSRESDSRNPDSQTVALVTSVTEPQLGSSIDDFRSAWGLPSAEENLSRTANLKWNRTLTKGEPIVPGVFAVEVAFLDGIACEIALRSRQRITPNKLRQLTKPFLTAFRYADFAKPKSDFNGFLVYELSDGSFVSVNKHEKHRVIVITGPSYIRNESVFDREAAKVRPPTSNP
jgi:hypothetical protein